MIQNRPSTSLIAFLALAFVSLYTSAQFSHAQDNIDSSEGKTFVEQCLEGATVTYPAAWIWNPIPGKFAAFEITISAPQDWSRAYLCVDGKAFKTIKPSKNLFRWSFAALSAGDHTVGLIVVAQDGSLGHLTKVISR